MTEAPVQFGVVPPEHWYQPSWINETLAEQNRIELSKIPGDWPIPYALSVSYRNMCRFNSGVRAASACNPEKEADKLSSSFSDMGYWRSISGTGESNPMSASLATSTSIREPTYSFHELHLTFDL